LARLLSGLPRGNDPRALVGFDGSDDAAVFRLGDARDPNAMAIVATIDFFTPVVESPYDFGRVAAANALSDVYAMGGEPLFALNVVGFPTKKLPLDVLSEILRGGSAIATEAGMSILGGHSTDFDVPVYGLAVTGQVAASRIRRNVGARDGDALVLTKAVGTGILTSALRGQVLAERSFVGRMRRHAAVTEEEEEAAVASMARLNRSAARAGDAFHVSATTDVTGYGVLGHLREMLGAGGLDAEVAVSSVPLLPGARRLAAERIAPEGTGKNLAAVRALLDVAAGVEETDLVLLADAQTSGGLLVALPETEADDFVRVAREAGDTVSARIGRFAKGGGRIRVTA
jgi:selenide,water dikinase